MAAAQAEQINLRDLRRRRGGIALDEPTTVEELRRCLRSLGTTARSISPRWRADGNCLYPAPHARTSAFLTHPVFNSYHTEHEMLRYIKRLEARDLSLTHSMIPLGSCTMKLNATTEMIPVTWPEFAKIHPFAPADQAAGYRALFASLERWLAEITGFAAVSLQPNAGSQGEYSGLLAIRGYHQARGEGHRHICLIPSSAHGTNPASAVMAGMEVVVVACDEHGNVDLADLRAKADAAQRQPGCAHGHLSLHPRRLRGSHHRDLRHHPRAWRAGLHGRGQHERPGGPHQPRAHRRGRLPPEPAQDLLHSPRRRRAGHGAHLRGRATWRPICPTVQSCQASGGQASVGSVSAAPWGSASILPISYAYIAMMGGAGLTARHRDRDPERQLCGEAAGTLLSGALQGRQRPGRPRVHPRHPPLKDLAGIEAEDIAKRLMDYGFHAPTMSFPVPGTLMIEPTESESLAELERFCQAMIAIREEIQAVADGRMERENNPLKHAPHTAEVVTGAWERPYSRELAAFPLPWVKERKFWPYVSRIDNVYGDRHLVCACLPVEAYA